VDYQTIAVTCENDSDRLETKAKDIGVSLSLPFLEPGRDPGRFQFVLHLSTRGLELKARLGKEKKYSTCFIDFTHGTSGYRLHHNRTIHQPLAKACGVVSGFRPDIIDVTAGLGGDAFVLASLGCRVTLVERSPILGALLADGLERAEKDKKSADIVNKHLTLIVDHSFNQLRRSDLQPYTVYMDPMYPHRKKSALNKLEMRIIRQLVGDDLDSPTLFQQALQTAANRVVVKRPKGAPTIDQNQPSHTIDMKNSRFDVYLVKHGFKR